jgi:hypothetical protein
VQGAGKGKALEFILKELKEAGAYPEAGVQVGGRLQQLDDPYPVSCERHSWEMLSGGQNGQ